MNYKAIRFTLLLVYLRAVGAKKNDSCSSEDNFTPDLIVGAGNFASLEADDAGGCCEACQEDDKCLAWTFEDSEKMCYLKDDYFYKFVKSGAVSGLSGRRSVYGDGKIPRACSTDETLSFPFCDTALPTQDRVNDIISRLTVAEKAKMLTARESPDGAVERLGIPEYDWGANCIHGVQSRCTIPDENGDIKCPTSFPNPIGLAASYNRVMWKNMAEIIGVELRALWLEGVGENHENNLPHLGLDCWSPNLNIARDPRWGRILETTGEDPYLTGEFGGAYTSGLQLNPEIDADHLQAIVTLKHFAAYSVENYGNESRHTFNAVVSDYDAASTFFPAFKAAVTEGDAKGVMCSYNEFNGVPSCGNDWLLKDVLRGDLENGGFGFDGYVTSDSGAVEDIYKTHKYNDASPQQGISYALQATCDVDSSLDHGSDSTGSPYTWFLQDALDEDLLSMDDVDAALNRTLFLRFQLGLFDPDDEDTNQFWNVDPEVIGQQKHVEMSAEAARQSYVLLRNDNDVILPFTRGQKIAVVAPHSNATKNLVGNYLGQFCEGGISDFSCIQTPFEAIKEANAGADVFIAAGCSNTTCEDGSLIDDAVAVADDADLVVMIVGIDSNTIERESEDRVEIGLPGQQNVLIASILALNKPTAVVMLHGGPLAIDFLASYSKNDNLAVMSVFYPSTYGSATIAEAIFGDFNVGGRLPYMMPGERYIEENDFLVMDMNEGVGSTYRYYSGDHQLNDFAYGLSYAKFDVVDNDADFHEKGVTKLLDDNDDGDSLVVSFDLSVTRIDRVTTFDSAQQILTVFIKNLSHDNEGEIRYKVKKTLVDFTRTEDIGTGGETASVLFNVKVSSFALANDDGEMYVFPGTYVVEINDGRRAAIETTVTLTGEKILISSFPSKM